MKKVLIIGDDSYIGCNIKKWLDSFKNQYLVDIVSSRNNRWKTEADFSIYETVVNTAGLAHINNRTDEMKSLFYSINCDMPIAIAIWAKQHGVKHFIHFSSMNVYGDYCDNLKSRNCEKPTGFYGDSKYQGDLGLKKLEDSTFIISYIRPPFVYGKGCKGNYNNVVKMSLKLPIFPNYPNKKSMIYIENLSEFVRKVIDVEMGGILTPQNRELVSTCDLVSEIANIHGKKLKTPKFFNPLLSILIKHLRQFRRGFGNDNYELKLSNYFDFDYCIVNFKDSIKKTEC